MTTRVLRAGISVAGVFIFVFIAVRLIGDPIGLYLPDSPTNEEVNALRSRLGLDRPIHEQFAVFVRSAVEGDFGISQRFRRPAVDIVAEHFPRTLLLTTAAMTIAALVGVICGVLAAVCRGSWVDSVISVLVMLGQAMPNFWLGIMLIIVFSVYLGWFPTSGTGQARHLVLPAVTLGAYSTAAMTRLVRDGMLGVLRQDYVRTAKSKGLSRSRVVWRHAFANALTAVLTFAGLQYGVLIGGAVVTESVFAWPGLGRLLIQSIYSGDYPVVQVGVLAIASTVVMVNLLIDLMYTVVDPRVRIS